MPQLRQPSRLQLALVLLGAAAAPLGAQSKAPAVLEKKLHREATKTLLAFARAAKNNVMHADAARAYRYVIERYDRDHGGARRALGFNKVKGVWQAPKASPPRNAGDTTQAQRIKTSWQRATKKLATRHLKLAVAAREAGGEEVARRNFARVIDYDAHNRTAHLALGHVEHEGFFGTAQDVAFLKRFAAIEAKAKELTSSEPEVRPISLDELPATLRRSGLTYTGARAAQFEIWTTDEQSATDDIVRWALRANALLEYLLQGQDEHLEHLATGRSDMAWYCMFANDPQRDQFFRANPDTLGERNIKDISRFGGTSVKVGEQTAELSWNHIGSRAEHIVCAVVQKSWIAYGNPGLGQGLMHTISRLLVGTTRAHYGALPSTETRAEASRKPNPLSRISGLRQQIKEQKDWPLIQIPRERYASFRTDVRTKSFLFMHWLIARHPDDWADLLFAIPWNDIPMPEGVDAIIQRELGRTVESVEAEWRRWARGDTAIARASGFDAL